MNHRNTDGRALTDLLEQVQRGVESLSLSRLTPEHIAQIAKKTACLAQRLLHENMEMELSREATVEELTPQHIKQICTMASNLSVESISDAKKALVILRQCGFEVRKFSSTEFIPNDPRLRESPNQWIFDQVESGALPRSATKIEESFMICEIRPKPDVHNNEYWVQQPYADDPFVGELSALHQQIDDYKTKVGVLPNSRAAFTFHELRKYVLPALSKKAGVTFECMSTMHACILANDHPEISAGRSTEWRGDTIGESHAVISGRSDRGPIRYVYYDVMSDPYINRGFRLCVPLSISSDTESSS